MQIALVCQQPSCVEQQTVFMDFVSAVTCAPCEEGPKVTFCNPFNTILKDRASPQHDLQQFRQDRQWLKQALPYLILDKQTEVTQVFKVWRWSPWTPAGWRAALQTQLTLQRRFRDPAPVCPASVSLTNPTPLFLNPAKCFHYQLAYKQSGDPESDQRLSREKQG